MRLTTFGRAMSQKTVTSMLSERAEVHAPCPARVGHAVDAQAHPVDEAGDGDLADQFLAGAERLEIVPEAQPAHAERAEQHREEGARAIRAQRSG